MNALKKCLPFLMTAAIAFNFIGCADSKKQTEDMNIRQKQKGGTVPGGTKKTSDGQKAKGHEGHDHGSHEGHNH